MGFNSGFKGLRDLELGSFENRMQEKCLLYTLVVTGCARDTKASSEYFFSKVHPYIQHICRFQQLWNNINNINSLWLFIKLLFHHLKHLDSLEKRHANRPNVLGGLDAGKRIPTILTRSLYHCLQICTRKCCLLIISYQKKNAKLTCSGKKFSMCLSS